MLRKISLGFAIVLLTVAVMSLTGCPSTSQGNRIHVFNQTSYNIVGIYVSPTSSTTWGGNFLDQMVLGPGGDFYAIDLDDGCYDVLAVSAGGGQTQNQVCLYGGEIADWTLFNAKSGEESLDNEASIGGKPNDGSSQEIPYVAPTDDNPGEPKTVMTP